MENWFRIPSNNIVIGQGESGKSTLIRYILTKYVELGLIHYVVVFCGNDNSYKKYVEFLPEKYVYKQYSDDVLMKIMKLQDYYNEGKTEANAVHCAVVFDDIHLYKKKFKQNSDWVIKLFDQKQHYRCTSFVVTQVQKLVTSDSIHSAINYAWIFKLNGEDEFKEAYARYGQKFESWKAFREYLSTRLVDKTEHKIIVHSRDDVKTPYRPVKFNKVENVYLDIDNEY